MVTINVWGAQDPAEVDKGGSGISSASMVAYAVVCGGTTTTAPFQPLASLGSAGQVLTSNGAAALPTWQTGAGGGGVWEYVSATVISDDATINFEGLTSGYDYSFVIYELIPETDGSALWARVGTGGGPTYQSASTDYLNGATGSTTVAQMVITANIGNSTDEAMWGWCDVIDPGNGAILTRVATKSGYVTSFPTPTTTEIASSYLAVTAVTAVQFLASADNLTSGTIRLYRRSLS